MKKIPAAYLAFAFLLLTQQASACAGHFYGFDRSSLLDRSTLAGRSSIEPVFKLKHPPMTKVAPGEEHEVVVEYKRPKLSEGVTIAFTSTGGIQLQDKSLVLKDYEGAIKVRYTHNQGNYNSINLKVTGTHNGEVVNRSSVIYVRTQRVSPTEGTRVSAR
jgi:hypothetical protein